MRTALVVVQGGTFIGLAFLLRHDAPKLAAAQALLAVVTWLVYA